MSECCHFNSIKIVGFDHEKREVLTEKTNCKCFEQAKQNIKKTIADKNNEDWADAGYDNRYWDKVFWKSGNE